MLFLRNAIGIITLCVTIPITSAARVRDVNQQRNQVTVMTNRAGEFAMGAKIYFFRAGKPTGSAQIMQAFHTKAIARIAEGNPQIGDDASTNKKPPKIAPKVHRVSFGATGVQAQEYFVEVQFTGQEKQERKLTLNTEIAAQLAGAPGFIGVNAALIKELQVVWENAALRIEKIRLADKSSMDVTGLIASDLYAKIKPDAASRSGKVTGKIVFLKKVRDLGELYDGIAIELNAAKSSDYLRAGNAYKLKVYCNELFASEFLLRPQGNDLSEAMVLNPVDLAPAGNNLEFRLVAITEQGELQLETDDNRLIGTLTIDRLPADHKARVAVKLGKGFDSVVTETKSGNP